MHIFVSIVVFFFFSNIDSFCPPPQLYQVCSIFFLILATLSNKLSHLWIWCCTSVSFHFSVKMKNILQILGLWASDFIWILVFPVIAGEQWWFLWKTVKVNIFAVLAPFLFATFFILCFSFWGLIIFRIWLIDIQGVNCSFFDLTVC